MTERTGSEGPTGRDDVKYGGTLAAGGAFAGCSDLVDSSPDSNRTPDGTGSHSATMPPVGTVEFDAVPESSLDHEGFVADITDGNR